MRTEGWPSTLRLALRRSSIPLSQQFRAAVEVATISGELPPGTPLPSVRQVSRRLGIATGTVVRAYQSLVAEGIVRAEPRRGFLTAATAEPPRGSARLGIEGAVDRAIDAAAAAEVDVHTLFRLVRERVRQKMVAPRRVAVVGYRDGSLDKMTRVVADGVNDMDVRVVDISYDELSEGLSPERSAGIDLYLVPVLKVTDAQMLLGPDADRIIPMTRVLRAEVQEFIRLQPPTTRFGIIAAGNEFAGRILAVLLGLHPLHTPPIAASVLNPQEVRAVAAAADVLVIGSLGSRLMAAYEPLPVPSVEFTFVPDAATLSRLRSRLLPLMVA